MSCHERRDHSAPLVLDTKNSKYPPSGPKLKMGYCKAADVVWAATASLHRKREATEAFTSQEIHNEVRELGFGNIKSGTIKNNITTYCVGNHPVTTSYKSCLTYKHCKLFEKDGMYGLWRSDDEPDPDRDIGQVKSKVDPPGCQGFIEWYCNEYKDKTPSPSNALDVPDLVNAQAGHTVTDLQPDGDQAIIIASAELQKRVSLNVVRKYKPVGIVMLTKKEDAPPSKAIEFVTRFVRNSNVVKHIKNLYGNRCQVCRYTIHTPSGRYSEVHHLYPLGEGGHDDSTNMLVLCPTHHVEFDYAVLGISDDGISVVNRDDKIVRKMGIPLKHSLDQKNIKHHLERMRRAGASRMYRQH